MTLPELFESVNRVFPTHPDRPNYMALASDQQTKMLCLVVHIEAESFRVKTNDPESWLHMSVQEFENYLVGHLGTIRQFVLPFRKLSQKAEAETTVVSATKTVDSGTVGAVRSPSLVNVAVIPE
jgi:hypothetical protein